MEDQGLEKIPFEFRNYCWEKASTADKDHWEVFKTNIVQIRFGGVSSLSEAKRLFWAEQINHKLFLDTNISPKQMALNLSQDIQNGFQNISRPISSAQDAEDQTMEILNYYFPTSQNLQNFQLAFDGAFEPINTKTEINTKTQNYESAFFEDDFEIPQPEPIKTSVKINKIPVLSSGKGSDYERPKIKTYLKLKQNTNDLSAFNELSEKIKKVINEHFFEI